MAGKTGASTKKYFFPVLQVDLRKGSLDFRSGCLPRTFLSQKDLIHRLATGTSGLVSRKHNLSGLNHTTVNRKRFAITNL